MDAAASSSSSAALPPKKYDVFISFRGEDTRTNFTSHLYEALRQKNVETYIDYRLDKGDEISQALIQAIHDSSVSLVVFSENYASSKWCLDELTQILQCKEEEGQRVLPIFYKVDPSDVRKQNGSYKEAFAKHERDFMHNQDKVNMWKDALFQTAKLAGWDSRTCRDESQLIQNIVSDILQKLDLMYPSALKDLVGIDENCKCIESLLEEVPIIGIWGMGGIGKTTMAKAVFTKLSPQYESCCFLENVREESEKLGLNYIRDNLFNELLKEEILRGSTSKVSRSAFLRRRLSCKKVLIVFDDVSSSKHLDDLTKECDCLGAGSKVIITTRDKHLLIGRVNKIYEARALSHHQSLKLFSFKAFHKDHPEIGFQHLSERAITYGKGIPLVLIILGSFLHSKTKEEWDSALTKLKKTPNEDIQNVLKLSYDGLDYEEREIFLDISCFLKGIDKEKVIRLLESFGFHAIIGIRTLLDKALITVDDKVRMHDLIQEMGCEIVRQECIKEPEKRSRLCNPEDIYDVLKNNKGTDIVEGIILDMSQMKDLYLSANTFKKMSKLRFLQIYYHSFWKPGNVYLPFGLESFSNRLRYLHWDRYPLESLPSTFCAKDLVELHLGRSCVKKLWDGVQDLVNLKIVNLEGSMQLVELPDFSKAQNLELVDLRFCQSLCNVHPSILSLHTLDTLRLYGCSSLKSLHSERHLKSLRQLSVLGCYSLKEFSLSSEKITALNLRDTEIEILHSSIGRLSKLESLILNGSRLKNLPINEMSCLTSLENLTVSSCRLLIDKPILHILFNGLRSLRELYLKGCSNLAEVSDNINNLLSLRILSLDGSSVESLPSSIKHLSKLEVIYLRECRRLRSLPQLPPFLRRLDATGCTSLETAFTLSTSYRFGSVFLVNCAKMDEHSLWGIMVDAYFSLMRLVYMYWPWNFSHRSSVFCYPGSGVFCYPGSRVPEWFGYNRTTEASITIELAPTLDNLRGFIFCAVIPLFTKKTYSPCSLKFEAFLVDGGEVRIPIGTITIELSMFLSSPQKISIKSLNLSHVLQWVDILFFQKLVEEVKRRQSKQRTAYNPKVSFKFLFNFSDYLIKEYGVYPLYALEDQNLAEEGSLHFKKKKWTKTKRHLRINEEEQLSPKKKLKATIEDSMDQKHKDLDQKIEELILKTIGIEDGD